MITLKFLQVILSRNNVLGEAGFFSLGWGLVIGIILGKLSQLVCLNNRATKKKRKDWYN
jgi:hypothetical protein